MYQRAPETIFEQRLRALRSVIAGLNCVLPSDFAAYRRTLNSPPIWVRYYPQRDLLVGVAEWVENDDELAAANAILSQALAEISEPARRECERAAVTWLGKQEAYAAAFDTVNKNPRLIAASWQPRHLWEVPVPDPEQSPARALDDALVMLHLEVDRALKEGHAAANTAAIKGILKLCAACFRWGNGVAPGASEMLPADPSRWRAWMDDYLRAARAEQRRLFPEARTSAFPMSKDTTTGALRGARIFLSYAMPTNVQIAQPVRRALEVEGAEVWFDQSERPDPAALRQGLREHIAQNNIFLLCASAELFENAGYALQELAWVQDLCTEGAWSGKVCIMQLDELGLPRAFARVPRVDLSELDIREWPQMIVHLISRTLSSSAGEAVPTTPAWHTLGLARDSGPALEALRRRALHTRAWWNFDMKAAEQDLADGSLRAAITPRFSAITRVAKDLEWDGFIASYDTWPEDPVVREARLRFAVQRCLFLCRTMDLDGLIDTERFRAELEFLAMRRPPMLDEPNVAGWDDEERRLGVRYYLSALRLLKEIVRRGLSPGVVINFSEVEEDRWLQGFDERRQDCADCLLELRRAGRVRWDGVRVVHWDAAYEAMDRFLGSGTEQWDRKVPDWVLLGLSGTSFDISILAADVIWRCSRRDRAEWRRLTTKGKEHFELEIRAKTQGESAELGGAWREVMLEVSLGTQGDLDLALRWTDPTFGAGEARAAKRVRL